MKKKLPQKSIFYFNFTLNVHRRLQLRFVGVLDLIFHMKTKTKISNFLSLLVLPQNLSDPKFFILNILGYYKNKRYRISDLNVFITLTDIH